MRSMRSSLVAMVLLVISVSVYASDISSLIKDLGTKAKAKDASEALAKIGKPAVPALVEALRDKDRHRARYAARALRHIGQDAADAIPALSRSLEDPDTETRVYAVEALEKMIQQADEIIPVLQKATRDKRDDVRKAAEAAINKLQSSHTDKAGIEQRVKERLNRQAGKKCLSVQLEQQSANVYRGFVEFEDSSKVEIMVTTNRGELQYSFTQVAKDASVKLPANIPTSQESGYAHVEWKVPDLNDPAYYAIFVDGREIGYRVTTRISDAQRVTTSNVVSVPIRKNDALVYAFYEMEKNIETLAGEPLAFEYEEFTFEKGKPIDRVRTGGTVSLQGKVDLIKRTIEGDVKHTVDWPKGTLMSEGRRLFFTQKQMKEGQEYSLRLFSPETIGAENYTYRVGKKKKVGLIGGEALLTEVEVTEGEGVCTRYYDDLGRMYKQMNPAKDANDSKWETIACSNSCEEHVGNNIQKTEFQREYELLEEETAEFIRQSSGKSLDTMTVIDVKRIWNKWTDLQFRWMYTLEGRIPKAGAFKEIQQLPDDYILRAVPNWLFRLDSGYGDSFPKIDFMSPKVFYKVFGKPQRTQIAPENVAGSADEYYFWYACRDGTVPIKVLIEEYTKEKYEVLIVVVTDMMSF